MSRSLSLLALLLIVVGSLAAVARPPAVAARPVPAAPLVPPVLERIALTPQQAISPLDCSTTPFGNVLLLGGENEIFVGYKGGFGAASQGEVQLDRLDLGASNQFDREVSVSLGPAWPNTNWLTTTSGDINSDGADEYLQVFTDASGRVQIATYRNGQPLTVQPYVYTNNQYLAAATGKLLRSSADRVAVAARTGGGSLQVQVSNPLVNSEAPLGVWRDRVGARLNPIDISIATGDLDGDGFNDEIVVAYRQSGDVAQLVVLEYMPGHLVDGGQLRYESNIRELASARMPIDTPLSFKVATGDLDNIAADGDGRDEIIFVQENATVDDPGISTGVQLRTLSLDGSTTPNRIVGKGAWAIGGRTSDLALASGDTDNDGRDEIAIAYRTYGANAGLTIRTLDAELATIRPYNMWSNNASFRDAPQWLSLAVGDLDKNGDEIVAAFRDSGSQNQVIRLLDQEFDPAVTPTSLRLVGERRDGDGGRNGAFPITLQLADWDNDSLKAHYAPVAGGTIKCATVTEPNITAAVFTPPYWSKIQAGQYRYASIGKSREVSEEQSNAFTTSRSHSVSAFFGGGIEGEVASLKARVTAGYEYAASTTRSGGFSGGSETSDGWLNDGGSFVVLENATYNCYSYQAREGSTNKDGALRFCEFKRAEELAPTINTWDQQYGTRTNPDSRQWTPIGRDWSSLALFGNAVQSGNGSNTTGAAQLAIDGNTDGVFANNSVTLTANNGQPTWWQVDLGKAQPIRSIRLWNRTDTNCGAELCPARLSDFHVLVSNTDFRSISNNLSTLLADSRVRSYRNDGIAGKVTSIQTLTDALGPITGRYVRIQLNNPGSLSLAEVQVFGPNEVEPDRYPISVWEDDLRRDGQNNLIRYSGTNGWFWARIFDPTTRLFKDVRVRGNLKWNGADYNVLANKTVGPGEGIPTWSLTKSRTTFTTDAEEISHTARVGVEFEAEGGVFVKVAAGGGYEYSAGITREESRTLSWGESFEIGGGQEGFPERVDGQPVVWPMECNYRYQPFYYETSEQSTFGYEHRMLVVDYTVPEQSLNRSIPLAACRQGEFAAASLLYLPMIRK